MTHIGETAQVEEEDLKDRGIVKKVIEGKIDDVTYYDEYKGCTTGNAKAKCEDQLTVECTKC